jgi:DNA-binding response OmpR family regulator
LVVEDEALIVMMLEDILDELGYAVASTAQSVDEAMAALDQNAFDAVILDVNLGEERSWPVAALLKARGTPFVLSTGASTNDTPAEFADVPNIRKPYAFEELDRALSAMFSSEAS